MSEPDGFCLHKMGYPLMKDQIGQWDFITLAGMSIFAIYGSCVDSAVNSSTAIVSMSTDHINKRFNNPLSKWVSFMAKVFREKVPNRESVENDELAAYYSRIVPVINDSILEKTIFIESAVTIVKGKPLSFYLIYEGSTPKLDEKRYVKLKKWIHNIHNLN